MREPGEPSAGRPQMGQPQQLLGAQLRKQSDRGWPSLLLYAKSVSIPGQEMRMFQSGIVCANSSVGPLGGNGAVRQALGIPSGLVHGFAVPVQVPGPTGLLLGPWERCR